MCNTYKLVYSLFKENKMWRFLLVFVCFSFNVAAQHCQIKGTVTDSEGRQPLDSVRIEIYEGSLIYKIIYTDEVGHYDSKMFQVIDKVSFRLTRNDYEKRSIRFQKLKGNNVIFMDIGMKKISEEERKKQKLKEEKKSATKLRKKRYAKPGRRTLLPF